MIGQVAVRRFPALTVSTPRIEVRHLVAADAEAMDEVFADRQTQRWLPLADASGQIDGRAWCTELARQRRDSGDGDHWAVVRREDQRVVGSLFGLAESDMPETIEDFEDYFRGMLRGGDLYVSDEARDMAVQIVLRPPVPLAARPVLELVNQTTIGLLPASVRRLYGFRWDPLRGLAVRGGAEYLRRVVVPVLPGRLRLVPAARAA